MRVRPQNGCAVEAFAPKTSSGGIGTLKKLSTATGLLYGGMLDRTNLDVDAYYLGAVDFATGLEVFRIRLGVGDAANIGLSPTYIGPDGAILQPVRAGVYRVIDSEPPAAAPSSDGCTVTGHSSTGSMLGPLWLLVVMLGLVRRHASTSPQ